MHIDDATTNSKNVMSTVVYFLIFDVQQPTGQYPQCLVGSINPIHRYFSPGFPIAFYHFFQLSTSVKWERNRLFSWFSHGSWVFPMLLWLLPLSFPISHGFFFGPAARTVCRKVKAEEYLFFQHLADDHNIRHTHYSKI